MEAMRAATVLGADTGVAELAARNQASQLAFEQATGGLAMQKEETVLRVAQAKGGIAQQRAQKWTEYEYDIANIRNASSDALRNLNQSLEGAILATRQRQEDVKAEADAMRAGYLRQIAEVKKERQYVQKNRSLALWGARIGAGADILGSAFTLLGNLPKKSSKLTGGGATQLEQ